MVINDSTVRWQGRTIEQLGYAVNLILGLSVAALGYEISIILNADIMRLPWQNCLIVVSLISLVVSTLSGLACVINRLSDFRLTTDITRKREKGASDEDLEKLRSSSKKFGKRAWMLFWVQILSFGAGVLLLVAAMAETLAGKLS